MPLLQQMSVVSDGRREEILTLMFRVLDQFAHHRLYDSNIAIYDRVSHDRPIGDGYRY